MSASAITENSRSLTRQQQALVEVIAAAAEQGKALTREEAGTLAGYGTGETARVQASRALALPHVRRALIETAQQVVAADALHAVHLLRHLRSSGGRDRLPATIETLKLTGMGQQDHGSGGGGITLQLVIGAEAAALMGQQQQIPAVIIDSTDADNTRSAVPRRPKAATTPHPKRKAKAKARGAVQKAPRKPAAPPMRVIRPTSEDGNGSGSDE